MVVLTVAASAAVHCASALVCYDCTTALTSRTGKVACDGDEQDWRTCTVENGGSCLLMELGKRNTSFYRVYELIAIAEMKPGSLKISRRNTCSPFLVSVIA